MKKTKYFENLDGIRFICFLSVFFYHGFQTDSDLVRNSVAYDFIKNDVFGNGNLGVNFFFVLSGFLITYILIQEKKNVEQINIKNFFIRRCLRIWPLFYFCVLFGFLIFPFIKTFFGQLPNETANPLLYILFLNNFDTIINGTPDASILGVLWSVAIEEQFYLVWPFIMYYFPVKKYWIPFFIILAMSVIFRWFYNNEIYNEIHTLSCIGDMTVGAFGAWLISEYGGVKTTFQNLSKTKIFLLYLFAGVIFFFRTELFHEIFAIKIFERIIIGIVFLSIIFEQNYSEKSFFKFSNFQIISRLGKISYGLYCLHFVGILVAITLTRKITFIPEFWKVILLDTSLALLITIVLSSISYKFIESPLLRIKTKFESY